VIRCVVAGSRGSSSPIYKIIMKKLSPKIEELRAAHTPVARSGRYRPCYDTNNRALFMRRFRQVLDTRDVPRWTTVGGYDRFLVDQGER
jgi:hypothetical protein